MSKDKILRSAHDAQTADALFRELESVLSKYSLPLEALGEVMVEVTARVGVCVFLSTEGDASTRANIATMFMSTLYKRSSESFAAALKKEIGGIHDQQKTH